MLFIKRLLLLLFSTSCWTPIRRVPRCTRLWRTHTHLRWVPDSAPCWMRWWHKPPLSIHRTLRCPPDPTIWFLFPCPKIRRKTEIRRDLSYIFFHFLSSVDLEFTLEIFAESRDKSQKSFFDLDAHLARYLLPADTMPTLTWHASCSPPPPPPPPGGGGGGGGCTFRANLIYYLLIYLSALLLYLTILYLTMYISPIRKYCISSIMTQL